MLKLGSPRSCWLDAVSSAVLSLSEPAAAVVSGDAGADTGATFGFGTIVMRGALMLTFPSLHETQRRLDLNQLATREQPSTQKLKSFPSRAAVTS
jgi:hypothetical protein